MYTNRSRSDWENVWHHESHTRCRDKLVRHLYWACDKDIYRLERRSGRVGGADRQDDQHAIEKQDCIYAIFLKLTSKFFNKLYIFF